MGSQRRLRSHITFRHIPAFKQFGFGQYGDLGRTRAIARQLLGLAVVAGNAPSGTQKNRGLIGASDRSVSSPPRMSRQVVSLVEEIRGKIRRRGIKPTFLRRLGPYLNKEELESIYKKKRARNSHFRENATFLCVFKKNETSRPPPVPTSDNYDKTPLSNGPTHHPDNTLVPPPRSLRPARIPARNPRARRHHTRGVRDARRLHELHRSV